MLEGGMMRERALLMTSIACLLAALGCGSNLTNPDSGTRGLGGGASAGALGSGGVAGAGGMGGSGGRQTGGTGIDASADATIDAAAGTTCAALADPTTSPPPSPPRAGCPCTRTPGPGNSFQCPMGAGQTSYATIGPAGGQIMLLGQQSKTTNVPFGIKFPPGALVTDTRISVTETDLPPPSGVLDWSPVYLVEPRGLELAKVASVQIPWSSNLTALPNTLGIYARDESGSCAFKRLVDSYTNAGFEQASLTQFGYLLVGVASTVNPATCGADASAGD
ncbi:MAG TPA: hypothetical protein VHO67_10045 [Polyangia bacterium]|nr:hypothetical protein [Polyangia bacterium]